jgi:signal transduction histidine kinase
MRRRWWRNALQQRLGSLTAAALILWTVATAVAASLAAGRVAGAILDERQIRARGIASRIELALEDDLRQLDRVAAASLRSGGEDVLAGQVGRVRLAEAVIRVDRQGNVLWARSAAGGKPIAPVVDHLAEFAREQWHVEGTNLLETAAGPRALLILPARESDPLGGALAAVIDPGTSALRTLMASYAEEPYRVELLDERGRVIASSRRTGAAAADDDDRLLIASAPISDSRWHVRIAQPRADALAPVLTLRRILVGSAALLLPFAVLVAVGAARSIRQPVLAMTATAERLARGEVAAPVPPAGEDEIGRLALALEQLRRTLQGDERRTQLLKRVMSAQEEERRRIARELHDQTTQQLSALAMQLDAAAAARPNAAEALARAQSIVRSAIDDLHRLIHDLRPSMLDDLGLLPAIGSYADSHLSAHGIVVHCEFPAAVPTLPPEAATALYRVAQEAITNVARHAAAETVLIACTVSPDRIVIEIEDDGVGFEPASVTQPRESGEGLGLLGMRERVALLGGRLDIESESGRGTRVVAELPIAAPAGGRSA